MRNFIVTVDGNRYEVSVEEVGAGEEVHAPVLSPAPSAPAPAPAPAAPANGQKILSPFPGLIKNVLVQSGATVKKDQPILVLEAMKMDNDITSPCDGKVTICVSKGANVESDAVLAIVG